MSDRVRFRVVDALYIALMILPFLACMVIKVLFTPVSEGISITGARVYFTIDMPLQSLPITESQLNSAAVILFLLGLCLYLTHGLSTTPTLKRQHLCEMAVEATQSFVDSNMGVRFSGFAPFVAAIMALSAISSLSSLLGLFPPTSDLNIVAGWAILVFALITYYKLKGGFLLYLKSFIDPVPILAPFNVISEVATPVSMSLRHYGNILSGSVIAALVGSALSGLTQLVLGWLPAGIGDIPLLQIGIPALLSIYFDLFSGLLQAFIFAMLTMIYVSNAFNEEDYLAKMKKRAARRERRLKAKQEKLLNKI